MSLPLFIFPCAIKSRSSLLALAHPVGSGKRAIKRLWCVSGGESSVKGGSDEVLSGAPKSRGLRRLIALMGRMQDGVSSAIPPAASGGLGNAISSSHWSLGQATPQPLKAI